MPFTQRHLHRGYHRRSEHPTDTAEDGYAGSRCFIWCNTQSMTWR